jgi:hypothetical protein
MTTNNNAADQRPQKCTAILLAAVLLVLLNATAVADDWIYTVRPGDNLWNLSETHLTSMKYWKPLQRHNNISDPLHIPPGSRLKFPIAWLKHQPAAATVIQLQGEAHLISATDGSSRPLTNNTRLHSGDRITTGPDGNLSIRFADGSELLVLSDSEITMDSLSAYGTTGMVDTRIRLQGGRIDTRVKPGQGPGSRYHIITPAAVAAVRGTEFRVSADTDKPVARSEVITGKVGVSGAGASELVPAGFGTIAEAGQPPQPPRELLPAPDLAPLPALLDRLPLQFKWKSVENAAAYRFQVAGNSKFDLLLADDTSQHAAATTDLPDGEYILRIRAIDKDRLEGLNATRAFTVDARPEPPLLIGLGGGILIRDAQPDFTWSTTPADTGWYFQLARDADFNELVADLSDRSKPQFRPQQPLPEGDYFWRVATYQGDSNPGPFSDAQNFSFHPLPPGPELAAPDISENEMAFHWQAVAGAAHYHFQLASDPDFEDIVIERTVTEPHVVIPRPSPGRYYFRAQTLDAHAAAGPYGITYEISVPPTSYWPILFVFLPLLFI